MAPRVATAAKNARDVGRGKSARRWTFLGALPCAAAATCGVPSVLKLASVQPATAEDYGASLPGVPAKTGAYNESLLLHSPDLKSPDTLPLLHLFPFLRLPHFLHPSPPFNIFSIYMFSLYDPSASLTIVTPESFSVSHAHTSTHTPRTLLNQT